jgi:hypothetical protein
METQFADHGALRAELRAWWQTAGPLSKPVRLGYESGADSLVQYLRRKLG